MYTIQSVCYSATTVFIARPSVPWKHWCLDTILGNSPPSPHTHSHTHTLAQRKPIQQLTVVSSQRRLLALVDGLLYLMNMSTLELYDTGQRMVKVCRYERLSWGNLWSFCDIIALLLYHLCTCVYICVCLL